MKALLDTHVWLWSHLDPDRLSKRCRTSLTRAGTELWLSPVSLWETLVLVEKGRLRIKLDGAAWIEQALARAPMRDATFSREVALASRRVAVPHGDPADRFLAATAQVHDLVLVTADEQLLGGTGYRTLKAD